jgi:peroxiredoxin
MSVSYLAVGGTAGSLSGGGCWSERLLGEALPGGALAATAGAGGSWVDLAGCSRERLVVFVHPGVERGVGSSRDPDGLLGSGCTVQSRGYRDLALDFQALGINVLGVSTPAIEEQQSFALREGLPFALLSDPGLLLHRELGLPTYLTPAGERVYERLSFLAHEGVIQRVFHPVPIPRRNATDILTHLNHHLIYG